MIEIRKTTDRNDINIPNQPFGLSGRLAVTFDGSGWSWSAVGTEEGSMCFPDFHYEPNPDTTFIGAYDGGRCVGLAVLRREMSAYLYLDDLKVNADRRGRGVGSMLVEACIREASAQGRRGVHVVAQDNNLAACMFYLHRGFAIGGYDNMTYRGTKQEGKADVHFYIDCPKP